MYKSFSDFSSLNPKSNTKPIVMFDATNICCYFPKIDVLSHSHLFFVYHIDVGMLAGWVVFQLFLIYSNSFNNNKQSNAIQISGKNYLMLFVLLVTNHIGLQSDNHSRLKLVQ